VEIKLHSNATIESHCIQFKWNSNVIELNSSSNSIGFIFDQIIQIHLKKNGIKIGAKSVENLLMTMVLGKKKTLNIHKYEKTSFHSFYLGIN
jgi:hypothetical protein